MTDAASGTPAAELRQRLSEVAASLAGARALAESRAEELRSDPTEARMAQRREAAERVELLDLQRQAIEAQLEQATEVERQDGIQGHLTRHSVEVQGPAAASERRAREHLSGLEHELSELMGLRNQTRATARALLSLGCEEFPPQVGLRVDDELVRRLEALASQYKAALKQVGGQVGRLMGAG